MNAAILLDSTTTGATPGAARHNLGPVDRIPLGEGRSCEVGGMQVAVFRARNGEIFAVQATCPHAGGPLADGLIGDGRVICPLHGHAFDLRTGSSLRGGCASLRTFPVSTTPAGDILLEDVPQQR